MSTITRPRTTYTPDDLLAMPDRKNFELVDGNLVERNVSVMSSLVAANVLSLLHNHCEPTHLAWIVGADCGVQCFPDRPDKVRRPDVSLVLRNRLPVERLDEGYVRIAPDLVVEVISPNDLAYEVERKVEEYLGAGVPLVWVVDPPTRTVRIHRQDGTAARLRQDDELSGETVVPGFRCLVRDLFPPQAASAPAPAA